MGDVSARLSELGIVLPSIASPSGNYIPYRFVGSLLFVSGQIPRIDGVEHFVGVVGQDISLEEGYKAARLCALNILARVNDALDGDLDRVVACVQVRGFVNAPADFKGHPAIVDGASDLLVEILGEKGRHVRTALGAGSLPRGSSVEVDAVFEVAAKS
ncbi:RidA family protein (plasmid) [Ensifer adhaerens]|uniref:RidA family protein n=1 Tax=Ensifer adhaerens TaxID=106592 RepID=UPI001CBCB2C8|nr:RidA family protein [Ensifer adhaerens]MBZ7927130.1 RidA family protein [Ensifer adhaerens]UAX98169.1 RidA family protein [Ensifer adhaerens]UAY05551.1 RidA family protein [Ensifer adhaerens]UAY12929.1 RidA family protein [Ensifer adhaerens]